MLRTVLIVLLCTLPLATLAEEADGPGFVERFLQRSLSDDTRQVSIEGLSGAWRGKARLERLSISDPSGEWLVIENAVLDWKLTAILRGDIKITELSAELIDVRRRPVSEAPNRPNAAATPFELPNLPVSISIGKIETDDLRLGAGILSNRLPETRFSLTGNASLDDGAGSAALEINRLDNVSGSFDLSVSFDNETRNLDLGVTLAEDQNGLVATLLRIPETPSLSLNLQGDAPIDAFEANLTLDTAGERRLSGQFSTRIEAESQDRVFVADAHGDLTKLFHPEFRDFFGTELRVSTRARVTTIGALHVEEAAIIAKTVRFQASGTIDEAGWPTLIQLDGQISDPTGQVRLPVPGDPISIGSANISLSYDKAQSSAIEGSFRGSNLTTSAFQASEIDLSLDGIISREDEMFDFGGAFSANGLSIMDNAIQQAVGETINIQFATRRTENAGTEITVQNLAIAAGGANGQFVFSGFGKGINTVFDVQLNLPDLNAFSALANQTLSGAVSARAMGSANLLSGSFDVDLAGNGRDLAVGMASLDLLTAGILTLDVAAKRDETGFQIPRAILQSDHASIQASTQITDSESEATVSLDIATLSRIVPGFPGRATLQINATEANNQIALSGTASGPGDLSLSINGTIPSDFSNADISVDGRAQLALANPFLTPRKLSGSAQGSLRLNGGFGLSNVSGSISMSGAELVDPSLPFALTNGSGTINLAGSTAQIVIDANGSDGGALGVNGSLGLQSPYPSNIALNLSDFIIQQENALHSSASGEIRLLGNLSGQVSAEGDIAVGPTEIRLSRFNAGRSGLLEDIQHIAEPTGVRQTRAQAGLLKSSTAARGSGALDLNIRLSAPNQIFVRGRGLDAELGGTLTLRGKSNDIRPEGAYSLIRGRLDLLWHRLTLDEATVLLEGAFDPILSLKASAANQSVSLTVTVSGPASAPDLTITSTPPLPQDEALSRFLFGRGLSQLSPLQAAQLAAALVTLTGDGTGGPLNQLREATGLDDFDITTDDAGDGLAVRAGKYLSDNVYSDVTIGADGQSSITLNLDVSPKLTLRGTANSNGSTGLGFFFETDY